MKPLVVGNWKMHKTAAQTAVFVEEFCALQSELGEQLATVDVAIAPPFTSLHAAARLLTGSGIALGAQNVHWAKSGAFTGEVSAEMLVELGVSYAIVGHSERRQYFGESDSDVHRRAVAALEAGITPIVCVGETLAERDAGRAHERIVAQTRAALDGFAPDDVARVVVAYEPVWAIGTGRNCDPADADAAMAQIRSCVPELAKVRLLYGGSVKPENVALYTSRANVNGGLVGGASLEPLSFAELIRHAVKEVSER